MIPSFDGFMLPLLKAVADGKEYTSKDIVRIVSDSLGLSEEERNKVMKSKRNKRQTVAYNRTHWARLFLKKAGLLEAPSMGKIKITQQGLNVLNEDQISKIDRKYLRRFDSFSEWENKSRDGANVTDEPVSSSDTPEDTIQGGIEEYNEMLYANLLEEVSKISPYDFEKLVLDLLERMYGGVVEQTKHSRDGGFDGIVYEDELGLGKIYIQCKRYDSNNHIRPKDIDAFIGVLDASSKKGIFITTSKFTPDAEDRVKNRSDVSVALVDGDHLAKLMNKYGVGVAEKESITINEIDQDYFAEFDSAD